MSLCRYALMAMTGAASTAMPYAAAQMYPVRPVTLVQGFAPGGNVDTVARILAQEMSKGLEQSVVVESKPGAGGTIGANAVAKAAPDGYTLLLMPGGHAVAGALYKSLPYNTVNSFDMISTATFFPSLIISRPDMAAKSIRELLDLARAKPGGVTFGSAGIGSTQHLTGELLGSMAGVKFTHVPYKGGSAATMGLLRGDTQFVVTTATEALGQIRAGKIRGLAVTGPARWQGLPDVPTVAEAGVTGFDVRTWMGLATTAGTPPAIVERLKSEVHRSLRVSEVRSRLEDIGGEVRGSTPEEMRARVATELKNWTQIVREARIEQQ